ncbi:hypothetical protein BJY04DRAFT_206014 [Aspergillus karnatakaensis]|uniref:uncharacterized protein n=1 Tax=Aspergillus karnatakaensis TaxID=1810916 RepID=UPI003CCCBC1B
MSDDNASAGLKTIPLRRRESVELNSAARQLTPDPMGSSIPDADGNSSPRKTPLGIISDDGSMSSNRAQHSTTFSFPHARAGSVEPPDYVSDTVSDQVTEFAHSNHPQMHQSRNSRRPLSGTPRSRPVSRTAADNLTGKASPGGSESRLRYSVNSTDDIGSSEAVSRPHPAFRSSPVSYEERSPVTPSGGKEDISSLLKSSGEVTEGPSYGQESAKRLSADQRSAGEIYAVEGGTFYDQIIPQLFAYPVTEEQLLIEIQKIYAGLVMVEKRCMGYVKQVSDPQMRMDSLKWEKVIANHRTLLDEHHDFFLAAQLGGPLLQRLPERYGMPSRLWRHGIHALLELLRSRLPEQKEFMLSFIYFAYKMMTLMVETVPKFEDTWTECLGDLSRYRMAVEDVDIGEREIWVGIARYWYNKVADRNPEVGRVQHHLAVLARPDIVQELFYYTKSLVCARPFTHTRESLVPLFTPLLRSPRTARRLPELTAFVTGHVFLFSGDTSDAFLTKSTEFLSLLEQTVGRMGSAFKLQGVYITSCNLAAVMEYASPGAFLPAEFLASASQPKSMESIYLTPEQSWSPTDDPESVEVDFLAARDSEPSSPVIFYGSCLAFQTLSIILDQIGNKNVFPSFHTSLAFLWCLAQTPGGIKRVELVVPWKQIVTFLNTLIRNFTDFDLVEGDDFPSQGEERWLAEDFLIRGLTWSQHLYPEGFFINAPSADDGRNIEPPSRDLSRMHRCLWLGVRLAAFNRWMTYDATSRKFSTTEFASKLDELAQKHNLFYGKGLQKKPGTDAAMQDT